MASEKKCSRCGGGEFVDGVVQSAGTVSFRPKTTGLKKLVIGNVALSAQCCMGCGLVEMSAPLKEVGALLNKKEETAKA